MSYHVRWMIRRDMADVLAIESGKPVAEQWSEESILSALRERNTIGMVCEDTSNSDAILGYMLYELHKSRLEILSFAVCPHHRRQGVGSAMTSKLIGKLSTHRRNKLCLDVSEKLLDAHLFLKARGFAAVNVKKQHDEDDLYRFVYYAAADVPAAEGVATL